MDIVVQVFLFGFDFLMVWQINLFINYMSQVSNYRFSLRIKYFVSTNNWVNRTRKSSPHHDGATLTERHQCKYSLLIISPSFSQHSLKNEQYSLFSLKNSFTFTSKSSCFKNVIMSVNAFLRSQALSISATDILKTVVYFFVSQYDLMYKLKCFCLVVIKDPQNH